MTAAAPTVEITRLLREAAANEAAASRHDDRYSSQMKAAGANVYHAFKIALAGVEEFAGRRLDDKAVARIYQSPRPRPWWDTALATAKVAGKPATRDWGKRMIQWHMDPSAAQARRAQHTLAHLAARKKIEKQQRVKPTSGVSQDPRQGIGEEKRATRVDHSLDRHAAKITAGAETAALAGRELSLEVNRDSLGTILQTEDLLGEVNRISSAVRKVKPGQRADAFEILRVTARELEELAG